MSVLPAFRSKAALTVSLFAACGCAGGAPAPEIGVEPERAPAPVVRESARRLITPVRASFEYARGTVAYTVTSDATVSEIDSAGAPRSFREIARIGITVAPVGSHTLMTTSGSVEAMGSISTISLFADTLRADSVDTIAEPRMPICGRDTIPPAHLVTLLPQVPLELRERMQWQHRHVHWICQGSIPVRLERMDSYVVTGGALQVAGNGVTIARNSRLAYAGSGVEGQHNVTIAGVGSAQATFILDASAGRLVSAAEESSSEIEITASRRTRRFSQRVVRRVGQQ